jgi:hypothetical protein
MGRLFTAGFLATFTLGCLNGLIAVIEQVPSQWRIADLFFDVALAITMIYRGASLLKSSARESDGN